MPCEGCNVQFTVFRRKKTCNGCRRFYCTNCLRTSKCSAHLCSRCAVFAKRPLLRTDLQHLKPKDLIFYLQSKHISTTGCVEKDELVGLVLNHIQQVESAAENSGRDPFVGGGAQSSAADSAPSFDSLKQTCQNFFTNISDNISDTLAAFDTKTGDKPPDFGPGSQEQDAAGATHIFDQPRVSIRTMPTYANSQQPQTSTSRSGAGSRNEARNSSSSSPTENPSSVSPGVSLSSRSSQPPADDNAPHSSRADEGGGHGMDNQRRVLESDGECECDASDDEIIASYNSSKAERPPYENSSGAEEENEEEAAAGPSRHGQGQTGGTPQVKMDLCEADESAQSSFEELGAIGGISDDSKAATDTNSSTEQWQLLDSAPAAEPMPGVAEEVEQEAEGGGEVQPTAPPRAKRMTRRRSEGYLNRRRQPTSDEEMSPTAPRSFHIVTVYEGGGSEEWPTNTSASGAPTTQAQAPTARAHCKRCGKNNVNIRRQVDKMRQHLQSSQMSEQDIKAELQAFLMYLERRTKSVDYSDAGTPTSSLSCQTFARLAPNNDDDGIHVYASSSNWSDGNNSRFVNLDDFDTLKDLESMTVKQLKEVLMLHRVDYKGCCEKQDLLDRVQRLWVNRRQTPAVEKLPTDELCKICMDAPIECVILECGHMATCINCGKVLSECPICRQYIVRVVRFFRA